MIVPMKKIVVMTLSREASQALADLRDLGMVHVERKNSTEKPGSSRVKSEIQDLEKAIDVLSNFKPKALGGARPQSWLEKAREVISIAEKIEQLKTNLARGQAEIEAYLPWGSFDPQSVRDLAPAGIDAYLCELRKEDLRDFPADDVVQVVSRKGPLLRCLVLSRRGVKPLFPVVPLPKQGLREIRGERERDLAALKNLQEQLRQGAVLAGGLKRHCKVLTAELHFAEAAESMGSSDGLVYLQGYAPEPSMELLKAAAQKNSWALMIQDPEPDDNVPTFLRNPKWVGLVTPIFNFMNILPGYREADVSWTFLVFFSVFFGILVGDIGYGTMFFLATALFHRKNKSEAAMRPAFVLMYVLSGCAILWGVLTGSFFGQAWLAGKWPPLVPWLTEYHNIQKLCFIIAVVHLSIAHVWRMIVRLPSLTALAEGGWLLVLWATFFLVNLLILKEPIPSWGGPFFFAGLALIVLFSRPQKNVLKGVLSGVGVLLANALTFINNFSDIVSYIRLFAVGLATVAVADAFNQIAGSIGMNSVLAGFGAALILVFGHLLNLILCALAVVVHGIRLNVLEFSSHMNLEWSGVEYDPLRKTETEKSY
ncbi:MAG: hypothetical protein Q8Q08_06315 [Candidatus Omnitrophota bacterium]|nr:hypothetical protein [Candidatus Omnitrophota bacterium]MDZ4242112.1 hypothetical protein [Candidatus Omnitrophota bacterium]